MTETEGSSMHTVDNQEIHDAMIFDQGSQREIEAIAYDDIGGKVRELLDVHFRGAHQFHLAHQLELAQELIKTEKDQRPNRMIFLKFACADSRDVPYTLNTGDNLVITIPFAGQCLDESFDFGEIKALLPKINGIIMEGHEDCGACNAAAAAAKQGGHQPAGSLAELVHNVETKPVPNVLLQLETIRKALGPDALHENGVALIPAMNYIYHDEHPRELMPDFADVNDLSDERVIKAIETYKRMIAAGPDDNAAAEHGQHPPVLFMDGLSVSEQLERGIGSVHELLGLLEKGQVFKDKWNPEDPASVASAVYILSPHGEHPSSIRQIVASAASEEALRVKMAAFYQNSEISTLIAGMEILGVVVKDDATIDQEHLLQAV